MSLPDALLTGFGVLAAIALLVVPLIRKKRVGSCGCHECPGKRPRKPPARSTTSGDRLR